ncbi:MAG: hypothetical protein ABI629_08765 [bacterium]
MTSRRCADCPASITRPHARYCDACRWNHRGKPAKYLWTPERDRILRERYDSHVRGRADEIAAGFGWPKWVVSKRAIALGLSRPSWETTRRDWTEEEERFLVANAGRRHVHWMAKQLKRSLTSVVLKIKRMKISQRWREGYTLRELVLCFGTDHHVIERWVREERLKVRKRGTDRERDAWFVTDADILRFVLEHPLTFELRKVDQLWFMDLITGGAVIRKALGIAEADEAEADIVDAPPAAEAVSA